MHEMTKGQRKIDFPSRTKSESPTPRSALLQELGKCEAKGEKKAKGEALINIKTLQTKHFFFAPSARALLFTNCKSFLINL
jgi:hypothetical protein